MKVPAFSCAPKLVSKVTPSTSSSQPHGTPKSSTTKHYSASIPSTLRTSTRSSAPSSHTPTGTLSLVAVQPSSSHSSIRPSSSHSSGPPSSSHSQVQPSSTAPSSSLSTLSAYNGFTGAYCYTEGTSGPALDGKNTTSQNMTIETCLDVCEESGWGFAGLENSNK